MSVWVVVGGQFGSEGKGKISAIITLREEIDICIRCGGPNSGHSFQKQNGELVVLRQLPDGLRPTADQAIDPGRRAGEPRCITVRDSESWARREPRRHRPERDDRSGD